MNGDHWNKWKRTRKKGKRRYVLLYGSLLWGLTSGIIWALATLFLFPFKNQMEISIIGIALFPLCGLLWGSLMWNWTEKAYLKEIENQKN